MKKMAFFDIDGTMVNVPNGMHHPSAETQRVLKEFRRQGNYIVVATARTIIPDSVRDIEFDGYVCADGHYIEFQGEVLLNNTFTREQLEMQLAIYAQHNGHCELSGYNGEWVSSRSDENLKKHHAIYEGTDDLSSMPLVSDDINSVQANAIAAVFGSAEDLLAAKAKLPENWAITAYTDDIDIRMDVHPPGFNKGTGCQFLFEQLGIAREHTYAFGDGHNDIEMLQLVGNGIAMGNAAEIVKASADSVTDTVDNEGIAKAFGLHFGYA
jgi:Cof subfamily protein (haloacid dehalogenase superfamily)